MTKTKRITAILLAMLLLLSTIAMVACVPTFSVTKGNTVNGTFKLTVDNKQAQIAKQGATIEVIPSPSQNYEVDRVYYTYAGSTDETNVANTDRKYTFEMPASNITVYVSFKPTQTVVEPTAYTLTKGSTVNGTLSVVAGGKQVDTSVTIDKNTAIEVTAVADNGYLVSEVYYILQGGDKVLLASDSNDVYKLSMPQGNITIYATFVKTTSENNFTFELSEDGQYYSLTEYIGSDTDVVIPTTYNGLPVTHIEISAFGSTSIKSVFIPNSITYIGYSAFNTCESLTKVTFQNNSKLQTIDSGAFGSTALTEIRIPASVETIGEQAFDSSFSLASITFEPNSNLKQILGNAFGATAITTITIPASVTEIVSPFMSCEKLVSVVFEEGSQVKEIGDYYFMGCISLKSIVIPSSVTTISSQYPFLQCDALDTIYYGGDLSSRVTLANRPTTGTVYIITAKANKQVTIGTTMQTACPQSVTDKLNK